MKHPPKRIILVTGAHGFIGSNLIRELLAVPFHHVIGIDLHPMKLHIQDRRMHHMRKFAVNSTQVNPLSEYTFWDVDITDANRVQLLFEQYKIHTVYHLAALTGSQGSMSNPEPYISTNINGFFNVIRMAYTYNVPNFFYASSSSVYGDLAAIRLPMIEGDAVIHPKSIYAATKVSNEAVANSFAAMNSGMNIIGLRIFNTYGEYSRTDTAPFIFMKSINDQYPITLFKHGDALRDFMHINDLVNCLVTLLPASEANRIPHTVFNIGTGESISIGDLLHVICKVMGRTTTVNMLEDQPAGSVEYQCSDSSKFFNFIGRPNPKFVDPVEGITRMYEWFIHHNPDSDGY